MSRAPFLALLFLLLSAGLTVEVGAEEEKKKVLVPDAAARARLAKQKVLIADRPYASVATPYKARDLPYFITSDSIVGAYHLLLRESVARLEWGKIQALRPALAGMEEKLGDVLEGFELDPALMTAAERRARIVLWTGLILLGSAPSGVDREVLAAARAEVALIEAATASTKPAWYGPPDPDFLSVGYARFRPTALDASVPEVARGHRAIRWLAFLPFRISIDEEFLAWVMLAQAASHVPEAASAFGGYPELLGPGDEACLLDERLVLPRRVSKRTLALLQERAGALVSDSPVRDRVTAPGREPLPTVRILPSVSTDCARLLQSLSDRRFAATEPVLPPSLAVGAALGSPIAREALPEEDRARIKARGGFATSGSLFDRYLRCFAVLHEAPEEGAPAFMASRVWRLKSLQTTMAGWTGARHAWNLRIKETMAYFGMAEQPGFVEPVPKFFSGVAAVAEETGKRLEKLGVSEHSMARVVAIGRFEEIADVLEELGWESYRGEDKKPFWRKFWDLVWERPILRRGSSGLSYTVMKFLERGSRDSPASAEEYAEGVRMVRDCAQQLRLTGRAKQPWFREEWVPADEPLEPRWKLLAKTAKKLAGLGRGQLKGRPVSEEDAKWIRAYGRTLADIIDEPPTGDPTDDAFAVVSVCTDPATGRRLNSAVGRPRALYVLWPSDGKEILCRGVALPWHEFETDRPITDEQWRERLDADPPPKPHAVLRELYAD